MSGLSIANESLANDFIEEASTDDTSVTGPVLILVSLSLYLISFAPGKKEQKRFSKLFLENNILLLLNASQIQN